MTMTSVQKLRLLTNEDASDSDFTDADLQAVLTEKSDNVNRAAAQVWRLKAAKMADMVNITEGNSSRAWSQAYKQALEMAKTFDSLADGDSPSAGGPTARPRKIVRT